MLKGIRIINHRSNHSLKLLFSKHVTTICGESFQGKSNVLRALKWIALNKPAGISFISWGHKESSVLLATDKHRVRRTRSKSKNTYELDKQELHAFGNSVPDSVQNALRLSDLNFQTQQEIPHGSGPLFWFALSSGEVSRRLNAVVNLDLIDRIQTNAQKKLRTAQTLEREYERIVEEERNQSEQLAYAKQMFHDWQSIHQLHTDIQRITQQRNELRKLFTDAQNQKQKAAKLNKILSALQKDFAQFETLRQTIIETENDRDSLRIMIQRTQRMQTMMCELNEQKETTEQRYKQKMKGRCPLCNRKT
ncbi:MAG: hypothetical protein JRC90_10655 [Deltaproteobacteria bacterium]|nr:hypothetical protein [Deltaproteobacteria bacterium]